MAVPKYQGKALTNYLRKLAMEAETMTDEGEPLTKAELLASVLWKKALGWTEEKLDADGVSKEVVHAPEAWAIQLIYDRLEGRVAQSIPDTSEKRKVSERVSDLSKRRINDLTASVRLPFPPKLSKGDTDGSA